MNSTKHRQILPDNSVMCTKCVISGSACVVLVCYVTGVLKTFYVTQQLQYYIYSVIVVQCVENILRAKMDAEEQLPVEQTDDSCRLEYLTVLLSTGTDDVGRDWSAEEITRENMILVKQEPDDVCYISCVLVLLRFGNFC